VKRFFVFLFLLSALPALKGQDATWDFQAQNMTFERVGDYPQPINLVMTYNRQVFGKQSKEECVAGLEEVERGTLGAHSASEAGHQDYFYADARWLANPALRVDAYTYGWTCFRTFYIANGSGHAQLYKVTGRDNTKYDATKDIPLWSVTRFGANTGFVGWDQNLSSPAASTPQCSNAGDSWTCTGYVVVKTD
jgi:hypothetical protein